MVRYSTAMMLHMCGAFLHGDGLTSMQWREFPRPGMVNPGNETQAPKRNYEIIQLERRASGVCHACGAPG